MPGKQLVKSEFPFRKSTSSTEVRVVVAVCCSVLHVLQCTAVFCSVLQRVAVSYCGKPRVLTFCCSQCVAACCNVLWCVAVCCIGIQCAVVCCSLIFG